MIIGIDAGSLGIKDARLKVGTYQVAVNFLKQLKFIDNKNEYRLYSFSPIAENLLEKFGSNVKNVVVRPKYGWRYIGLPLSFFINRVDIFLGLNQSLPLTSFSPSIVIVYDLAFEHFPERYPDSYKKMRARTLLAVKRANKIIAISETTKKDLINLYGIQPETVKVAHAAFDAGFFKPDKNKKAEKYFLFVGALKRIKNIPGLLRGFRYFLDNSKEEFKLFLVGGDFWLDPEIDKTINKLNLKKCVQKTGFVDQKSLLALYRGATAFVSPSFYEGFGIPLLEAAASGCPVIAGKNGAAKEIIGKAGILVDPQNKKSIGEAMLTVCRDEKQRREMIAEGLERAGKFSWDNFAKKVLEVIHEVGNC
ncbi:glycosyltransferase family 4 protein [Patescibacteria group bacterium]|nr:glycosyltransferase family 4 protein [Patescibacteria group bacterium]MBU1931561.1 glycosyltransferase family 4 protein [Patescibacteria group bacterium]